ncbi:MAG: hypothetical protein GEU97_05895 [Actinophytocola sp.]|nr:hypothetical protein [Actinophytocola sp.]
MVRSLSDATAFATAAATGQIGIDPDAAQTVLKKIRTGKDQVDNLISQSVNLGVAPRLGANPVGAAIAAKYSDRANGGRDSYAQALRNLRAQYEQVENAIVAAIKNYDEMEAAGVRSFDGKA